jgi:cyanophycinase
MCLPLVASAQAKPAYQYFRAGNLTDLVTKTTPGYALMGGGEDLDEAFRWMCDRSAGGDFLILRARGTPAYNPYVQKICKVNSVATLVIPSRDAANDPFVADAIRHAEAVFIAGGDQANYIRYWMGTPVQAEINAAIQRGVPLGGTSAGLAVLGEWAYSAEGDKPDDPNLDSAMALNEPGGPRVTLVRNFLNIPVLKGIITDSHFAKRDRMGRLLVFLFRINEPDGKETPPPSFTARGVGIEQGAALLLEPDGDAVVVGGGNVYFTEQIAAAFASEKDSALTGFKAVVHRVAPNHRFNIRIWQGDASVYELAIKDRKIFPSEQRALLY